ncbi:MAG: putative 3-methyladenine DNA glycosylase [Chlamydiae bacterium]|nr:putative 3-methyladenine DNA glycosylase [Chlamydiota bacterium]
MRILPKEFYLDDDVVFLAKELLGKWLLTEIDGEITGGEIIETEAYKGAEDRACHAFGNRKTERTKVMFDEGGVAYIYFCYGMHNLFNVITNQEETPHAVLIRAITPTIGLETMKKRRKFTKGKQLTTGPGNVCKALCIDKTLNGHPLTHSPLWIEDRGKSIPEEKICAGPRVGVAYAREDALLPWRFRVQSLLESHILLESQS